MREENKLRLILSMADTADRQAIYRIRHNVYATELGQYESRPDGILEDIADTRSVYIAAYVDEEVVGFVGITPPNSPRFSIDKYLPRDEIPFSFDDRLYEIRALTVTRPLRGSLIASALMYAAFRWVEAHGGTRILSIGRREVLNTYLRIGLKQVGCSFQCGAVIYDLISAETSEIAAELTRFDSQLRRLKDHVDWRLPVVFRRPSECYHGGSFFDAIGDQFDNLSRKEDVINADVLDAWFPPAPSATQVLQEQLPWVMRTSPPNHSEGLVRSIAHVRGVEPNCILTGGGSSSLMFLALRHWLNQDSRVLILDPTYGEYVHVLEKIVQCQVERFVLNRDEGHRLDLDRLLCKLSEGFDLFIWVNPNSPTGLYVSRTEAETFLRKVSAKTRVWLDETYVEYAGSGCSLEPFAVFTENVVVCKSLSKVYALSGLRVGYLCGSPHQLEVLRSLTPPWSVSLPAQIAATYALQSPDYYAKRYQQTHKFREELVHELIDLGITEIIPGIANFILFYLPADGPDAATVVKQCQSQGLFLRDVGNMGLEMGSHAIRIAVKDPSTNRRMVGILRSIFNKQGRYPESPEILRNKLEQNFHNSSLPVAIRKG